MFKFGSALYYSMDELGLQFGHEIVQCATELDIYTGFIPSQLMPNTSGRCYSL